MVEAGDFKMMIEAGDRVEKGGRQGTVKSADSVQANVAWDDGGESYVAPAQVGLTALPPLAEGTRVKHKWTNTVGQLVYTPRRGDTLGTVKWRSGHVSNILLDVLAPTSPQEPQENKRTVNEALAELDAERSEWKRKEREASYKVEALTDQIKFLTNAKRYPELARSIEKW